MEIHPKIHALSFDFSHFRPFHRAFPNLRVKKKAPPEDDAYNLNRISNLCI